MVLKAKVLELYWDIAGSLIIQTFVTQIIIVISQALEIEQTRKAEKLAEKEEQQRLEREKEERARKERQEEGFQCLVKEEQARLQKEEEERIIKGNLYKNSLPYHLEIL